MRKGLRPLPLAVQARIDAHKDCKSWPVVDLCRHPGVLLDYLVALPCTCRAVARQKKGIRALISVIHIALRLARYMSEI